MIFVSHDPEKWVGGLPDCFDLLDPLCAFVRFDDLQGDDYHYFMQFVPESALQSVAEAIDDARNVYLDWWESIR